MQRQHRVQAPASFMEHTLEKEKMEAVKELAATSVKISEARNLLFKLQEEETEYLETREKKALGKINKIFKDSEELLDKTHKNYEEIHGLCRNLSEYADFLSEAHETFQGMLESFEKRNEIWDENAKKATAELARQRKVVEEDAEAVKQANKRIKEEKESLKKSAEHIESQRQALLTAYKVEKNLWEKLQKK